MSGTGSTNSNDGSPSNNSSPDLPGVAHSPENPVFDNCAICRSTLEGGNLSTTPCGHSFHFGCLVTSMNTSNVCPICRSSLRPPSPAETVVETHGSISRRTHSSSSSRRGGRGLGIVSAISSRPIHVDTSGNNSIRVSAPSTVNNDAPGTRDRVSTPVNTSDSGHRRDRYPIRESREDIDTEEVHVELDIEDFANDVEIRTEILSGLIHTSCRQGSLSAIRHLIAENPELLYSRGDMGDLLTHEAVLSESETMLMYIINEQSIDINLPNSVHMYPLHYAVMSGSLRMVTILVNRGAHVDCYNDSKMTPLMLSCETDESEITQFLLDRGASFRTQDGTGNYPLHIASKAKSYSCVTKLISAGSRVNVKNHVHDTPLHISCRLGFHSVSRLLLEEGADPETDNKFDYSPLDEASTNGNTRIRNLLSRYV